MRKFSTLAAVLALLALNATAQQPQTQPSPQPQPQTLPAAPAQQPTTTSPAPPPPKPNDGHEYAPLQEREIEYKDWTFPQLATNEPLNLRQWSRGKRLVLVAYFAPWCANWRMERPVLARLYDKYHRHGFDVVAVGNYATPADFKTHFDARPAPYAVVIESDSREARDKTAHYAYRQKTGDTRKWGSPYNVFLVPSKLKSGGDVLTEKAWIVGGELVEAEVEQFIRKRLGLPKEAEPKSDSKADAKAPAKP